MSRPVNATYTSAQTNTVLVSASKWPTRIKAVLFTASGLNTNTPSMSVSHGPVVMIHHPGVTAGGGLAFSGLDCGPMVGDITFSCADPGGSVGVTVIYEDV